MDNGQKLMEESPSSNSGGTVRPVDRKPPGWVAIASTAIGGLAAGALAMYLGFSIWMGSRAEADIDPVTACEEQMRQFTDYPLLYAGPEALGYPLAGCRHNKTEDRFAPDGTRSHVATDSFTLIYGSCDIPAGRSSCPIPVSIIMYPPCHSSLDAGAAKETTLVRGAMALVKSDGSLRIEAQSHKLTLYAPGASIQERKENATRIAEALIPANALAAPLTRNEPLSKALAPSRVCP